MSVMMVLRIDADPKKLEERAAADPDGMRAISQKAASYGMIAHRFYACGDQIVVVDEWPDEESFHSFFAAMQDTIGSMFQSIGMTGQPHPEFWHKLDTRDEVGWGA